MRDIYKREKKLSNLKNNFIHDWDRWLRFCFIGNSMSVLSHIS
jgi:hypothetical protein